MKRILLTGGSGFIGRNVIDFYKNSSEYEIISPTSKEFNCTNKDAVYDFLKNGKFDVVLNFAVPKGNQIMLDNGLRMYLNFAEHSDLFGRMICTGSGAEFDKSFDICSVTEEDLGKRIPADAYGIMKLTVNRMIEKSDNIYNFRLFGIFGKYELWERRFISNICCKSLFDLPLTMRQNVYFDYLYINDFLRILDTFLHIEKPKYHSYNCVRGERYDLLSLCKILNKVSNKENRIIVCKDGLGNEYTASNERLINEIPITFTLIEDSIEEMYNYYSENKEIIDISKLLY